MLTIGRFSELTRLSQKALRLYDELGLLPAAEVDPDTGYRRYRPDQAERARTIRLLRESGCSLVETRTVLEAGDRVSALGCLEELEARLDHEAARRRRALARLRRLFSDTDEAPAIEMLAAATAGDVATAHRLLARDASLVDAVDVYDKTPLHLAAEHDHAELASLLLAAGAELEAETGYDTVAVGGQHEQPGRRAAAPRCGGGAQPVGGGRARAAERGAGFPERRRPAAGRRRAGTVRAGRRRPLAEAARDDRRADDRVGGVQIATRNGHTETARYLLELGAGVDFRGFVGGTGLHWAAINGHLETVEFLLAHGADPTLRDHEFGADASGWAREGGHASTIDYLERS